MEPVDAEAGIYLVDVYPRASGPCCLDAARRRRSQLVELPRQREVSVLRLRTYALKLGHVSAHAQELTLQAVQGQRGRA